MKLSCSFIENEFDENTCKLAPAVTIIEYLIMIIRKLDLYIEAVTSQLGTTSLVPRISKALF